MGKFRKSCAFLCLATFSLGFGLMGCNKSNDKETPAEQTFTITFDSQGGSAVAAQTVKYGEKATKPSDPIKENFTFDAWYEDSAAVTKFDFDLAITADWTLYAGWLAGGSGGGGEDVPPSPSEDGRQDDPITSGASMKIGSRYYALEAYAETMGSPVNSWMKANFEAEDNEVVSFYVDGTVLSVFSDGNSSGNNITEEHPMSQSVQEVHIKTGGTMSVYLKEWTDAYTFWITTPSSGGEGGEGSGGQESDAHGPEGSVLVNWYIVGKGSLWTTEWSVAGGVQLFSNPSSENDKGCILDITFVAGDIFKVTDGNTWFGYEKVDQYDSENNKGKTDFEGVDDGMGGKNIKAKTGGSYNIYVNSSGTFWIEAAA